MQTPAYLNADLDIETRINDLLPRMTLEEKVAQLGSVGFEKLLDKNNNLDAKALKKMLGRSIGQITRIAGYKKGFMPKACARYFNQIQKFIINNSRHKIPAIIHEECLAGTMSRFATLFPQAISLAATFDPELAQEKAKEIATQVRSVGGQQGLCPVLDVLREPRWGRTEETMGEDPYLIAAMGTAYVRGLQFDMKKGIAATVKHFVAHGAPEGGRNCAPVAVGERMLRQTFLFPFEAVIKHANPLSLMNAYHELDGLPCTVNRKLLTGILREEWGWDGFIVSDYVTINMLENFHRTAASKEEAATLALQAGIDIELPTLNYYGDTLVNAVRAGRFPEATIDISVRRVLRGKFRLGLFENPFVSEKQPVLTDNPAARRLALKEAKESLVLIKNNGVLPFAKKLKAIAVVGPMADDKDYLCSDYQMNPHLRMVEGFKRYDEVNVVSILEGIKKQAGKVKVNFARGCGFDNDVSGFAKAMDAAYASDLVVAAVGEYSGLFGGGLSGEGDDRDDLHFAGAQEAFLKELKKSGKPLVVVLINGRPIASPWMYENADAILEAFFPGEEGGTAIASALFGEYNPAGRLPVSIPTTTGQIPIHYSLKPSSFREYVGRGPLKPAFAFGHGLSYTTFKYSDLMISPKVCGPFNAVQIACAVTNTGKVAGDEVVQLYLNDEFASFSRPVKELKGFKRITLKPGQKKYVKFTLHLEQMAFLDVVMQWVVEPGKFVVMVGASSADIRLRGSFTVKGEKQVIPQDARKYFTRVEVSTARPKLEKAAKVKTTGGKTGATGTAVITG